LILLSKTILLVEDEKILALAESRMLQKNGYQVITASSGEEALKLIQDHTAIDLILMDINLGSGMDGPQTSKKILEMINIPIVFLTSHSEKETVEKVKSITRYGYVIKNSGDFVLLSSIEMAFELFTAHQKTVSSQKLFYEMIELAVDGVLFGNHQGIITEANQKILEMLGKKKEEVVGKPIFSLFPENVLEEKPLRYDLIQKGETVIAERNLLRSDGTMITVEMHSKMMSDGSYQSFLRDMTERKKYEESLQESRDQFMKFMESIPFISFLKNSKSETLYINPKFSEIMGEFPIGKDFPESFPEKIARAMLNNDQLALEKGLIQTIETIPDKNGIKRIFETTKFSIHREGKTPLIGGFAIDITDYKETEKALLESEKRYKLLSEMTSDAASSSLVYPDGKIVREWIVGKVLDQYGYTAEEISSFEKWAKIVHPDDLQKYYQGIEELKKGKDISAELRIQTKNGETRWIHNNIYVIKEPESSFIRLLSSIKDITGKKRAEEKVKNLLLEKETLLKEVHHRIKNNMNTIAHFLYIQAGMLPDSNASSALLDARNRILSMMVIYDKLYRTTDYKNISTEDYFNSLIEEITATLHIHSSYEIKKEIGDFYFDNQILFPLGVIVNELITNSFKYAFSDHKNPQIFISLKKTAENKMELIIKDNGIGMPDEIDPLHSKGFGLNLVHLFTSQIGGEISIKRENGTEFRISFQESPAFGN